MRFGSTAWRAGAPVAFAAFLPDGKSVLVVTWDFSAVVFDLETGAERRRFDVTGGPDVKVERSAVDALRGDRSPSAVRVQTTADGRLLVAPGLDGTLRAYDVATGKVVHTGSANRHGGTLVAFSADGARLATRNEDSSVSVLDTATWKEVGKTPAPDAKAGDRRSPERIALSADGKKLFEAGESSDGTGSSTARTPYARVYDTDTGKPLDVTFEFRPTPKGRSNMMEHIAVSPDFKLIAKPTDKALVFYDLATGKEAGEITGVDSGTHQFAFVAGGRLVTGQGSGAIRESALTVWDAGKKQRVTRVTTNYKTHLARPWGWYSRWWTSADGKLAAIGYGTTLRVFRVEDGRQLNSVSPEAGVVDVQFIPDGKTVLARTQDGELRRWAVATGAVRKAATPGDPIFFNAISPDGGTVLSGEEPHPGTVRVYDAITGARRGEHRPTLGAGGVALNQGARAVFSPDSQHAIVTGRDIPAARLFGSNGTTAATLGIPSAGDGRGVSRMGAWAADFSPDSELVAVAVTGISVWEVKTARQLPWPATTFPGDAVALAFAPDKRTLALALRPDGKKESVGDETVSVVEASSGQLRFKIPLKAAAVPSAVLTPEFNRFSVLPQIRFSPDGRLIALPGSDRKVHVWDAYTGKELAAFPGTGCEVVAVAFSPDEKKLVSAGVDGLGFLWDVEPARKKIAPPAAPLTGEQLNAAWASLAAPKAEVAFSAGIAVLTTDPERAVPFLKETLSPPDDKRIAALAADVEGKNEAARDAAVAELEGFGPVARQTARDLSAKRLDQKTVNRLHALAQRLGEPVKPSGQSRVIRAVELLEVLAVGGSKPAAEVLKELAASKVDCHAAAEAKASVARLGGKP